MRINIPGVGLQDIDIEEVLERVSQPRPPLNKKRPKPKLPVNLENALISKRPIDSSAIREGFPGGIGMGGTQLGERITGPDAFNVMFGKGKSSRPNVSVEIPETINIPGVGQIQLPTPQSPAKTETDPRKFKDVFFGPKIDPNASELDKLKAEYEYLSGIRFVRDPGPGHWNKIKELAQQIYDLDNTFESPYLKKETQPVETLPVEDPLPVETQPDTITQPVPDYIKNPPPAPPVNPFEGFVPRNIIGPSFDPKDVSAQRQMVADARARMTPGANIQGGGYLTYDNPMLGNKQTQFGGYGQPMPTAPLMNYAGLSSPITYSTPAPDPDKEIIR